MSDIDLTPVNSGLLEVSKAISKLTPVGAGTVTDVSVVTANGVSGSVATSTTTPAITLSLGAITPSTVAIGAGSAITSSGAGGALGTAAFTAATAYDASGAATSAVSTHAALTTGVHGLAITAGQTLTVTSGGTIGSAAYTASTAYDAAGAAAARAAQGANTDITSLTLTAASTNKITDSGTNTVVTPWTISHDSSGTAAAGLGSGIKFQLQSSTTADQDAGQISAIWTTATHATRTSDIIFSNVYSGGALTENLRIKADGTLQGRSGSGQWNCQNLDAVTVKFNGGSFGGNGTTLFGPSDGNLRLTNNAANAFGLLQFGGTTNSYNAIGYDAVNGITLQSAAGTATWNDASTAASGTVANRYLFGIAAPTLTATNATVTDTVASTVYIGGAPTASTNTTIGTAYALNVAAGTAKFGGPVILPAGTTAAGTAPLKFTTQASPLTVVEQGTMELVGNSLQFTQKAKRRGVGMTEATITADTTWSAAVNGTTESGALITASHGAGYLEAGKMEEIVLVGTVAQRSNAGAILTMRVKYAGSTILTFATPNSTAIAANSALLVRVYTTCRTTGAPGTMQINAVMEVNGTATDPQAASLASIDTTTAQDTTITFQWGADNDAANTVTINQGRVLCVEPNR